MQQLQLKDKQPLKQPLKVQEHRRLPREQQLQELGERRLQRREQEHHHESSACCQKYVYEPGFRIRSVSGCGSAWIRINLICWIRIRIRIQIADPDPVPGGQNDPHIIEKSPEFSCFSVLDVLFWRLMASPGAWASFMEA